MGGPNLEVFKPLKLEQFGMYIMFPIGIMYYFGTNLDEKFTVPDFWPKPEQTHKLPYDRKEIEEELERLKARRLAARARRLELENRDAAQTGAQTTSGASPVLQALQQTEQNQPTWGDSRGQTAKSGWFAWGK